VGEQTATTAGPCTSVVATDALPTWARAGFNNDGSGVHHVLSRNGDIVAVLFDYPMPADADPDLGAKVLWVSRLPQLPMDPLRIHAALSGTSLTVSREVPEGPGPSHVALPRAGCWILELAWSGHTDSIMLQVA
jgi:hypothetical protein